MHSQDKAQQRQLRKLQDLAYERELSVALGALELEFRRWRAGEINAHELSDAIHSFHQGPSRHLWSRYQPSNARPSVAAAIHRGLITAEEAGDATLLALADAIAFLGHDDERAGE